MSLNHVERRYLVIAVCACLSAFLSGAQANEPSAPAIGSKVPAFVAQRDLRGNNRSLRDLANDRKALVLAFLGAECPVSKLYMPTLAELEKKYRGKGVQFLAIYANELEDIDQAAGHARDHDVAFLTLKDFGQKLSDLFGVTRVPTVVVLDSELAMRYRGRIDDRYGVSSRRQKATRADLAEALDELLAGKAVSVPETAADGCLIGRAPKRAATTSITYAKEISRLMQKNCQSCHRPGEAAPFSLLTYEDAVKHARTIKEVTAQRRMPPWHADPRYGHFSNSRRMTNDEVETLAAWVDAGTPRGNPKDEPDPIAWPAGWKLGKPDMVFSMPEEFEVPADGSLPYKHWEIDTGFTEDKWIRIAEARPGAASVVHHIVVYMLKPGQKKPFTNDGNMSVLVGWAPGDLGVNAPPETALRIPKGTRLLFEMHYTPIGKAVKDRSSVGITFTKEPRYEMIMNPFINESISLPPNDPHYKAEATWRPRADVRLIALTPHMHWRGKDYHYEIIYPDGRKETILSVPRWDFNWQNYYQFKDAVKLPVGARLHTVAHWDNSRNNPYNPDPSKNVKFGLQTWDEMMVGWVVYVYERPETLKDLPPQSPADQMFDRLDRNGDDFITAEEIPDQLRPLLLLSGANLPERADRATFTRLYEEMRERFQKTKQK
jgi:thiol-disulfide isomerase/thioredoxin